MIHILWHRFVWSLDWCYVIKLTAEQLRPSAPWAADESHPCLFPLYHYDRFHYLATIRAAYATTGPLVSAWGFETTSTCLNIVVSSSHCHRDNVAVLCYDLVQSLCLSLSVSVYTVSFGYMLIMCLCQTATHWKALCSAKNVVHMVINGAHESSQHVQRWISECEFSSLHSSALSLVLCFSIEWKASGSLCKPVQQYIKGEQSPRKWNHVNGQRPTHRAERE